MTTGFSKLLTAIHEKDWISAGARFKRIMEEKRQAAFLKERKVLFNEGALDKKRVTEDAGYTNTCSCGHTWKQSGDDDLPCPKCGEFDFDRMPNVNEADCKSCGKTLGPVDAMMGSVCGPCTKKAHKKVVGEATDHATYSVKEYEKKNPEFNKNGTEWPIYFKQGGEEFVVLDKKKGFFGGFKGVTYQSKSGKKITVTEAKEPKRQGSAKAVVDRLEQQALRVSGDESMGRKWKAALNKLGKTYLLQHPNDWEVKDHLGNVWDIWNEEVEQGDDYTAECQECGKVFKSKSMEPKCPKCHGYDIELKESAEAQCMVPPGLRNMVQRTNMANTSPILSAIQHKDWTTATEGVQAVLQQKVAQRLTQERREIGKHLVKEGATMPFNWDKGFEYPYAIGGGGSERPFIKNGKWYLYVYNRKTGRHEYFNYDDDIYIPDTEWVVKEDADVSEMPTKLSTAEVQRVYDEIGDTEETELLCGITGLFISGSGEVISFVTEAANRTGQAKN